MIEKYISNFLEKKNLITHKQKPTDNSLSKNVKMYYVYVSR